jgi:hypothetical protein
MTSPSAFRAAWHRELRHLAPGADDVLLRMLAGLLVAGDLRALTGVAAQLVDVARDLRFRGRVAEADGLAALAGALMRGGGRRPMFDVDPPDPPDPPRAA